MEGALDKVDEIVARLQLLQNTIQVATASMRLGVGSKREHSLAKPSNSGDWTQWSQSAQFVHGAVSDIVAAAKNAKELMLENSAYTIQLTRADSKREGRTLAALVDIEQVHDPHVQEAAPAQGSPASAMKATKVKHVHKAWKLSHIKATRPTAIMFPNAAYEAGPRAQVHRQASPVKSLPALIDRLPSKNRRTRPTSVSMGSASPAHRTKKRESIEERSDAAQTSSRQGSAETKVTLKRSSSGNALGARNSLGHSMLERAKGWMLGSQHRSEKISV